MWWPAIVKVILIIIVVIRARERGDVLINVVAHDRKYGDQMLRNVVMRS